MEEKKIVNSEVNEEELEEVVGGRRSKIHRWVQISRTPTPPTPPTPSTPTIKDEIAEAEETGFEEF